MENNSFELNFLLLSLFLVLCLFYAIFGILWLVFYKKYWCKLEIEIESIAKKNEYEIIAFSVKGKIKKIEVMWIVVYFTFFIIGNYVIFIYHSITLEIFLAHILGCNFLIFSSAIFSLYLIQHKWKKEFVKKIDDKKISDLNNFFKTKVEDFYLQSNSKFETNEIDEKNFQVYPKLFTMRNKNFCKKLAKIDQSNYEEIYFLIMKSIEFYVNLLRLHQYRKKDGEYLDKSCFLRNVFALLKCDSQI